MKKSVIIPALCWLFCFAVACNDLAPPPTATTPQNLQIEPSLAAFTDTLQKLDRNDTVAIERALQLYDVLAPHDSTGADSAAAALWSLINAVVTMGNDSILKDTADYTALLNPEQYTLTNRQKRVKTGLHTKRLKLVSDGEGSIYIVPRYETILPGITPKTSASVDTYLSLLAKEDTTPVFLDAGLAIELPDLVDRLVISEQLVNQKLPESFAREAARLNQFYTNALMMGADNSPSLDFETTVLNEEYKKAYDYLLAKYPSSKAAAKINVWLAVVTTGDKGKINDYRRTIQ